MASEAYQALPLPLIVKYNYVKEEIFNFTNSLNVTSFICVLFEKQLLSHGFIGTSELNQPLVIASCPTFHCMID